MTGRPALPQIDILVEAGGWPDEQAMRKLLESAVTQTGEIANLKLHPEQELSVVLTDDDGIQSLNREWRGKDRPTNVLSFPMEDRRPGTAAESPLLGDIVFAFDTISREAREQKKPFDDHFTHLAVHGFLHIFGYDHETDAEAEIMENLETRILSNIGIADPYLET